MYYLVDSADLYSKKYGHKMGTIQGSQNGVKAIVADSEHIEIKNAKGIEKFDTLDKAKAKQNL